jgi:DNA polymerase (family 10)
MMPLDKAAIAAVLQDIATLLELKGENPFKVRAYATGARLIETLSESEIDARVAAGTLAEVKGIGDALAQKIGELRTTGRLGFHEKLKASIPPGLVELLDIPGLGPKKVRALQAALGVETVAALEAACRSGAVAGLAGFGEKTQARLLEGIANRAAYGKRHLWFKAFAEAEPILAALRARPGVERAEHAGSLRRRMETVGDLDFLAATRDPRPVADWFVALPGVKEVTAHGETKASVRLASGLQADLRLVPPEQFVFALHHFTGSKDHNVQMRHRALERGLSLSEWGLVPAEGEGTAKEKAAAAAPRADIGSESDLFAALGLAPIPPELREGRGEIEAAEAGPLPRLLEEGDLRGVFHNHTTESDGHNTLEEMAAAAEARGWDYLGIADHSKSSFQARGLDEARLAAQVAAIRQLNASGRCRTHVFAGTECDILPDGRLDFADDVLAGLDYVVASVHSAFTLDREAQTRRILRALENPHVTMLGHPTGRLLLERPAYDVDLERVIDAAIAHGVVIELNASPWRLDLDWRLWRRAAERGLVCAINPDAHRAAQLDWFRAGVAAARKGWLTADHVLNTRPLAAVQAALAQRGPGRWR